MEGSAESSNTPLWSNVPCNVAALRMRYGSFEHSIDLLDVEPQDMRNRVWAQPARSQVLCRMRNFLGSPRSMRFGAGVVVVDQDCALAGRQDQSGRMFCGSRYGRWSRRPLAKIEAAVVCGDGLGFFASVSVLRIFLFLRW